MPEIRLECVSPDAARKVARDADKPSQGHRARAEGSAVILTYTDKRYPYDVAGWAFDQGHATDKAAADVIAGL
jgi:hypothetical protein